MNSFIPKWKKFLLENEGTSSLYVFDFDDTLAVCAAQNTVIRNGKKLVFGSDVYRTFVFQDGDKVDLTQWMDESLLMSSEPKMEVLDVAKKAQKDGATIKIITARPQFMANLMPNYLRKYGVRLSQSDVFGVGSEELFGKPFIVGEESKKINSRVASDKRDILEKVLKSGHYRDIHYYDDAEKNLSLAKQLNSDIDIHLVK